MSKTTTTLSFRCPQDMLDAIDSIGKEHYPTDKNSKTNSGCDRSKTLFHIIQAGIAALTDSEVKIEVRQSKTDSNTGASHGELTELVKKLVMENLPVIQPSNTQDDNVRQCEELIKQSIADGDIKGAIANSYAAAMGQFNGLFSELQELKKQLEELQSVPPSAAPIPPSADISPAIDNSPAPADNSPIVSIDELQLSTNSYNLIKREQINTVGDLLSYSEDDLLSIKGFGDVALNEVKDAMKRRIGLDFPQICNDQLKIPRATIENIRKTLIRKAITVSTKQIRKAFKDSGWNGSNYQEIREDVIKLLSNG
jgi:hypothetical protein